MEPKLESGTCEEKRRKKLGVLPNTQSEREEALFLKSSKTPKSPALVFLACLFCILFCVVGLLRELGRQAGLLARSLALSRFLCTQLLTKKGKALQTQQSVIRHVWNPGSARLLWQICRTTSSHSRVLSQVFSVSSCCCVVPCCFVLILSRLSSVVFFLVESSFVACVFASFCGSMEKLQSNVVCVCVCVWLNATGNVSGEWWCRLRHRGPDWSGLFVGDGGGCYLAHERLAIIDPASGDQPLFNETKEIVVAVRSRLPPFSLNAALFYFILFWDNFISAVEMCRDSAGKWVLHLCYWSRSF